LAAGAAPAEKPPLTPGTVAAAAAPPPHAPHAPQKPHTHAPPPHAGRHAHHAAMAAHKPHGRLPHHARHTRFQWIRAFDYLTCYAAHQLAIPPPAARVAGTVYTHLLWRFRTLFSDPAALQYGVVWLLEDLVRSAGAALAPPTATTNTPTSPPPPPLRLLSGHDVTLLPLLLALGRGSTHLTVRASPDAPATPLPPPTSGPRLVAPWPNYAAMMVMEVHDGGRLAGTLYNGDLARLPPAPPGAHSPAHFVADAGAPPPVYTISGELSLSDLRRLTAAIDARTPPPAALM